MSFYTNILDKVCVFFYLTYLLKYVIIYIAKEVITMTYVIIGVGFKEIFTSENRYNAKEKALSIAKENKLSSYIAFDERLTVIDERKVEL